MRLLQKGFIFFISFSTLFLMLRIYESFNIFNLNLLHTDLADLGGVPWLYSAVSIIFSVLAAFIIQNEWQQWSNLVAAVKGEIVGLEQLWHCANHLPEDARVSIYHPIHRYLTLLTTKGLDTISREDHAALDDVFITISAA